MSPIRTVVVGCGVIGTAHAGVLTRNPAYEVVALVDPKPEARASVAEVITKAGGDGAGAAQYDDLADALAAGGIDLASVCTPSGYHVDHATLAVRSGLHTMIEKPLDVSVAQGRALSKLVAERSDQGQVVSVISQHRFDPANLVIKQAVDAGRFGTITSAMASMAWYRSQGYYDGGDWRGTWELDGGGAVMNQAVHTVDLLRWFMGTPVEISAHAALLGHERIEVEDVATATVRFESGALATIHATTAAFPGLSTRIQVHGTQGSGIVDSDQLDYFYSAIDEGAALAEQSTTASNPRVENRAADQVPAEHLRGNHEDDRFARSHDRQFTDIAQAINDRRQPGVTVDEALASLTLVRAIYLSAEHRRPGSFADEAGGTNDDTLTPFGAK